MYFFLLFIFNGICKTFFNFFWISMRITFVAFFQSTFRLQSAPKTGQTRSHEFVNPSIILSLTFFHHHIFFYHSLPLRFPLNNSRKIRQGIEEGDNNSNERVTLFRRRTFRKFEREKIIRNLDKI